MPKNKDRKSEELKKRKYLLNFTNVAKLNIQKLLIIISYYSNLNNLMPFTNINYYSVILKKNYSESTIKKKIIP